MGHFMKNQTLKINPLEVFNARKLVVQSPHLHYANIFEKKHMYDLQRLENWVIDNLKGRFYIGHRIELVENTLRTGIDIGFENPKELTMFNLLYQPEK